MRKKKTALIVCVVMLALLGLACVLSVGEVQKLFYPREYTEYVTAYAAEYGVPEPLVYAVIRAESGFDERAESRVGAKGLMQMMPDTLDWLSRLIGEETPTDIFDPETNVKYGTYYLRHLYDRFGSWETALAAYNAGHGRVAEWLNDSRYSDDGQMLTEIPISETRNYVNKVMGNFDTYNKLYYNGEELL
ncbi:MAG: lytic transglycosylase domain-containing protein [Clostridia bacterium]|nr:lytic transglycosylase domain-containing protein [Clostridia bacterium]